MVCSLCAWKWNCSGVSLTSFTGAVPLMVRERVSVTVFDAFPLVAGTATVALDT